MEWTDWIGKRIFLRTIRGKVYSGTVKSIDDRQPPIIFLVMIDKYGEMVAVVTSEIVEIKEEGR